MHSFIWLYLTVYTKCIAFILIWSNQQIPVTREPCGDGIHYVAFSIIHHKRDPSRCCLFQRLGQMQVDGSHRATSAAIKLRRLSPRERSHPLPTVFAHVWAGDASTGGGIWRGFHLQAQFSGPSVRRLCCYLWHRRPPPIKSNKWPTIVKIGQVRHYQRIGNPQAWTNVCMFLSVSCVCVCDQKAILYLFSILIKHIEDQFPLCTLPKNNESSSFSSCATSKWTFFISGMDYEVFRPSILITLIIPADFYFIPWSEQNV